VRSRPTRPHSSARHNPTVTREHRMPNRSQMPYLGLVLLLRRLYSPVGTPDDFPRRANAHRGIPDHVSPAPTPATDEQPAIRRDMASARTFFLMLKVGMTAGDSSSLRSALYPIEVRVNGKPPPSTPLRTSNATYEEISTRAAGRNRRADEEDLTLGWMHRAADGASGSTSSAPICCTLGESYTRSITSEAVMHSVARAVCSETTGTRSRSCLPWHRLRLHGHGEAWPARRTGADRISKALDEVIWPVGKLAP